MENNNPPRSRTDSEATLVNTTLGFTPEDRNTDFLQLAQENRAAFTGPQIRWAQQEISAYPPQRALPGFLDYKTQSF